MHMRHMHMYIIIIALLSFFIDAFCLSSKLSVCFDVGIVAPYRSFVKHFFCVLSFFTKVFAHTPIAPVHYSLLIIHHSLFIGGACLPLKLRKGKTIGCGAKFSAALPCGEARTVSSATSTPGHRSKRIGTM